MGDGRPTCAPEVSVITLVLDRSVHLVNLVAGLMRSEQQPMELVVVDMGSADDPRGAVGALEPPFPVRWVDLPVAAQDGAALPLARARNAGADAAGGTVLLFCDVDCIPSATTVAAHQQAVREGALICGPVRYLERFWDAQLSAATGEMDAEIDAVLSTRSAPHPDRMAPATEVADQRYELFWSLLFATDPVTWQRIGGFDEGYVGYGGEDTDFAFRAREAGVELRWIPTGTAFHQWHRVSDPPREHLDDIVANATRFRRRWGTWPMGGWLNAFAEQRLISWSPSADIIERASSTTPSRPVRVLSIPASHSYVRRSTPDEVVMPDDPTDPWWPHRALEPEWIERRADEFDLVHVHFGFEHRSVAELQQWCEVLDRCDLPLVVTVHDLENPHLRDNDHHLALLGVMLAHASRVVTLTEGAAADIAKRWGRSAIVVPHPHVAPLDWAHTLIERVEQERALRVGIHFKEYRSATLDPDALVAGLAAGASKANATLSVLVGTDATQSDIDRVNQAADRAGVVSRMVPRMNDADLIRYLEGLDLSVLPYGAGTHSGWVELCHDIGTRVLAPDIGYYTEQWADVTRFDLAGPGVADPDSVAAGVISALTLSVQPAEPNQRARQRLDVQRRHLELYRSLMNWSTAPDDPPSIRRTAPFILR